MKTTYYLYFLLFVAVVLGMTSIATPNVLTDATEFSADRAFEHIEQIALLPHTIEDDSLDDVRDYLFDELTNLGLTPVIHTYLQTDEEYDITDVDNIIAQIDGTSNSYILVMAHYDSSPAKRIGEDAGSRGAADDGYGLSTILESIRVLQERDVEFTNGIKILFTDAEEIGLYGAKQEVENNPAFFDDVALVINIEARGVKGPNVMFQTSLDNYNIMKFYQNANYPVSFSLAGDVYSNMPNSTDLTPMLDHGLLGMNMAVLDNLDYYHTPEDNPDNVSLTSLQQYGENVVPLLEEFVTNEQYSDVDYFESNQGAMYFTILPNVFIVFSETTQLVLLVVTLLLFGFFVYRAIKLEKFTIKKYIIDTLLWIGIFIGMLFIGSIIALILSLFTGIPFSLTYMPRIPFNLGLFIIFMIGMTIGIGYLVHKMVQKNQQSDTLFYGGLTVLALFSVLLVLALPGGAYMFLLPLLLVNIIFIIEYFVKDNYQRIIYGLYIVAIVFIVMIFAPVLYLLYIALTLGALGIVFLFLSFPLMLVFPLIHKLT